MTRITRITTFIIIILILIGSRKTSESDTYTFHPVSISQVIKNNYFSSDEYSQIDSLFNKFIRHYQLKGASVAIAYDNKLIYAKGFGYADAENNETVEPYHLFRIASCSKLITAIAILKIIQDHQLSLNDKVFGINGILNDSIYLNYKDKRVEQITIKHLLEHSGGWRSRKNDPMFNYHFTAFKLRKSLPLKTEDIIEYNLTKKLDFTPGTRSSYSNLGYAILGKVIEKISGLPYDIYVKQNILIPAGIYDMHIGKSLEQERLNNEVKYYTQNEVNTLSFYDSSLVQVQYGGNDIQSLAAAGGWIAAPAELIKLILAIDGKNKQLDILNPESIDILFSQNKGYSPIGWKKTNGNIYIRTGTLSGTLAYIYYNKDGIIWIFETNTSYWKPNELRNTLNIIMNKVVSLIPNKTFDYFSLQY
jgi:CubicO group peptidase (beta-lactamase class C family)